jgi:hypothetical protein
MGNMKFIDKLKSKLSTKIEYTAPKPKKKVLIEVKKTPKAPKKPAFKQYGDKGYKPSSGKGVGY